MSGNVWKKGLREPSETWQAIRRVWIWTVIADPLVLRPDSFPPHPRRTEDEFKRLREVQTEWGHQAWQFWRPETKCDKKWGVRLAVMLAHQVAQPQTHTVCSGNFRMLYSLESLESYVSFRMVLTLNESIDASTKTYKNVCKSCKSQRSSPFSDSWGSCISSRRLAGFLGASCQLQTFQVTRQAPALQAVNQVHQHLIAPGPTEAYLFILFNAVGIFGWRANQVSWDIFLSWDTKFVLQIDHATMLVSAISALHWASFHVANKETLLKVWRYGVYPWIDLCIALA